MIKRSKPYKLIQDIVENNFILDCAYQYGFWPEIAANLKNTGRDQTLATASYPFVMVSVGYKEQKESDNQNAFSVVDLDIYIIAKSDKNLTTLQRETQIYDAILYPLYDELFTWLKKSPYILTDFNKIPHEAQNMYYLRTMGGEQNQLNDFVDGIEINIKDFKINKTYVDS
jgi:hypothetical protein